MKAPRLLSPLEVAISAPSCDPVIEEYKKHVDRTLLRENLKLSVEQRLRNLMELQKLSEELRRGGRKPR